jgi:hypothetical protein
MFNLTIARITARALFGRRRFLMLLPLPALLIGLAALSQSLGADPVEWGAAVILGLGIAVVLPVIALVVGTGCARLRDRRRHLAHILAKPLPRRDIVFSKLVVAVPGHLRGDRGAAGRHRVHRRHAPPRLGAHRSRRRSARSRTAACSPRCRC